MDQVRLLENTVLFSAHGRSLASLGITRRAEARVVLPNWYLTKNVSYLGILLTQFTGFAFPYTELEIIERVILSGGSRDLRQIPTRYIVT